MANENTKESNFLHHIPCADCGSSDACSVYDDGHTHCFSCGKTRSSNNVGKQGQAPRVPKETSGTSVLLSGEIVALKARGITAETCRKFNYQVGYRANKGAKGVHTVHIAPYYKDGKLVGQKIRDADKNFSSVGNMKGVELFGQQAWGQGGKRVVVTEGEIDAMSISQLQDNKWAVCSIPGGAQGAKRAIKDNLEWLESYEKVILCFDNDEAGQKAIEDCTPLFSPHKCSVATLPLKDANEMLGAGRGAELIQCLWNSKDYKPDGIVGITDLIQKLHQPLELGISWAWKGLTDATYGIRSGELYVLGAGTGMGKSEFWKEQMVHLAEHHELPVGGIFLEESPEHTIRCLASKIKDKLFHIPNENWTDEEFHKTIGDMAKDNKYYLYDHFGATDYEVIKKRIRFMAVSLDIKHIFIDHITALVSGDKDVDERKQIAYFMTDLASLAQELKLSLFLISHLNTPEGKPHEEGGRVTIKNFFGSRAIGQWANFVLGIERNQQHKDEELRQTSTLRILKDRYTGRSVGTCVYLKYEQSTGRLHEITDNPFEADNSTHTGEF